MIKIILKGKPLSRQTKFARRWSKKLGRYINVTYNPQEKDEFAIQLIIKNEARKYGFRRCDTVRLPVKFQFFINKNSKGRPPDPQNLPKVYCDALTRAGLIKDDSAKYLLLIYDHDKDYVREAGIESKTVLEIYD